MSPRPGKAFETFVARVEDERAKLRVPDEPVLRAFWPLVPPHIKAKLDMVHAVQCNLMGKHNAEVSWERIVEVCLNNRYSFAALAGMSEGPVEKDAPPPAQPMAPTQGQPAVPAAYVQTPAHVRRPDACFKVDTPCKLCQLMKKNA